MKTDEREILATKVAEWQKKDEEKRAAILITSEVNNEEQGNSAYTILGYEDQIILALVTKCKQSKDFKEMIKEVIRLADAEETKEYEPSIEEMLQCLVERIDCCTNNKNKKS